MADKQIIERGCDIHQALKDEWVTDDVRRFTFGAPNAKVLQIDMCADCREEYGVDRLVEVSIHLAPPAKGSSSRYQPKPIPPGQQGYTCPEPGCDAIFSTPQGVGAHRSATHGYVRQ